MAHEEFPEQSAAVILNHDGYRPLVDGKITLRIPVVRFAESVVESVRAEHLVTHVVKVAHHLQRILRCIYDGRKGGGGARRGDINSPVLVGGARVFGPKPRDYRFKLNKKVKILARKSALSYKAQESAIVMLEDFTFEAPKTKEFLSIIKNLKIEGKKVLFVLPESNKNVYLSARNLQRAEVILASNVNSYKVLNADVVVITEKSLETIDQILTK